MKSNESGENAKSEEEPNVYTGWIIILKKWKIKKKNNKSNMSDQETVTKTIQYMVLIQNATVY